MDNRDTSTANGRYVAKPPTHMGRADSDEDDQPMYTNGEDDIGVGMPKTNKKGRKNVGYNAGSNNNIGPQHGSTSNISTGKGKYVNVKEELNELEKRKGKKKEDSSQRDYVNVNNAVEEFQQKSKRKPTNKPPTPSRDDDHGRAMPAPAGHMGGKNLHGYINDGVAIQNPRAQNKSPSARSGKSRPHPKPRRAAAYDQEVPLEPEYVSHDPDSYYNVGSDYYNANS